MPEAIDWIRLWRDLVEAQSPSQADNIASEKDSRAVKPKERRPLLGRRWAKPDSNRDFIISQLDATPEATLLDIGAGTGKWAILLSKHARHVTAIDSSPTMIQAITENVRTEGIANVSIVRGAWPGVQVDSHDFSLCSHGMYGCADFPAFVSHMQQATRRTCFLLIRAPTMDGIMAEAAQRVWGHPYDSPNFQVAFNALLQMGIFPNVMMADSGLWDPWTSANLEEAMNEIKRRLGLGPVSEHDSFLMELLQRRLAVVDGVYIWPRSVRSAMIYWDVSQH